jgi:hypothetical protein
VRWPSLAATRGYATLPGPGCTNPPEPYVTSTGEARHGGWQRTQTTGPVAEPNYTRVGTGREGRALLARPLSGGAARAAPIQARLHSAVLAHMAVHPAAGAANPHGACS